MAVKATKANTASLLSYFKLAFLYFSILYSLITATGRENRREEKREERRRELRFTGKHRDHIFCLSIVPN